MDVFEAITTRRSIRKYKTDGIDEGTLNKVLEAARMAPSWKNSQCWRFIIVTDPAKKEAAADCLSTGNPGRTAVINAPVLIVACAEIGKSGTNAGEYATDKGDWFMYDTALAMQNLSLAAHALGLGTVHLGLFDAGKATELFDIPEGYRIVSMTPLGYPEDQPKPVPRKELSEITCRETFGT